MVPPMRSVPRSVLAAYAALFGLAAMLAFALRRVPAAPPVAPTPTPVYRRVHVTAVPPPLAALTAAVFGSERPSNPWLRAHDVFVDPELRAGFLVVDDGVHAPAALALAGLLRETSVTLDEARPLRVAIVDDEGHPLAGASLHAADAPWASAMAEAHADEGGVVVIARPPREAFRVMIRATGHVTRALDTSALGGEPLVLERTVPRSFEARDERDEPLTSARVWVAAGGAFEEVGDALTTPGTLTLPLPRKTAAPVRIETARGCSAPGLVLRGEGAAPVRVHLRDGWFQRIAVRSRAGTPLAARLRFGDPDDLRWRAEVRTSEEGVATLGPLCSAAVAITADVGEATATVVLRRGEVAEASLAVELPSSLRVMVSDDEGMATPNVRVALSPVESEEAHRSEDAPALLGRGFVPMGELGVTRGPVATLAELERDGFTQGAVGHPVTNQDGEVRLAHLAPGRVMVTLRRTGYTPATLGPVELVAGEEATLRGRLARAAHLEGNVLDDRGFPQRGHVVRLTDSSGKSSEIVTARDGRFTFDEARDDVVLAVLGRGGEELEHVALHLEPGSRTTHDLVVAGSQSREYRIRTLDSRGYPIEGASVALRPPGGLVRLAEARTARDGSASLAFPVGATLEAVARAPGFAPSAALLENESPEATLTLERSEARTVHLVDERRRAPVAGALVWLRTTQGQTATTGVRTSDRGGSVTFEAPVGAAIELVVAAGDHAVARSTIAGGAREATVALAPAVTFEGRVTNGEAGIEGATVAADGLGRVEPGLGTARSDREGRFRFSFASLATRSLEVCAPGYRCRRVTALRGDDRRPVDLGTIALERGPAGASGDVALDARASAAGLVVESVFPASKAAESSVRAGDVIVLVDGKSADLAKLAGPIGYSVVVTVDRNGSRTRVALLRERVLR
jgi:hypothetical protein